MTKRDDDNDNDDDEEGRKNYNISMFLRINKFIDFRNLCWNCEQHLFEQKKNLETIHIFKQSMISVDPWKTVYERFFVMLLIVFKSLIWPF